MHKRVWGVFVLHCIVLAAAWPGATLADAAPIDTVADCPYGMSYNKHQTLTCRCSPAAMTYDGRLFGTDVYTDDSHICKAARHSGTLPLSGGVVRVTWLPERSVFVGSARNGVTSGSYDQPSGAFHFEGTGRPPPDQDTDANIPDCPYGMSNNRNQTVACRCQPSSMTYDGRLFGTDVYTDDSFICKAARHAGVLSLSGGLLRAIWLPGQSSYLGSTRNGVTSAAYNQPNPGSFRVEPYGPAPQQPIADIQDCPYGLNAHQSLVCRCSPSAMVYDGRLFGTDTYTDDSHICKAARHSGVLPLSGGVVRATWLPNVPRFTGSTRNGVSSGSYDQAQGGYTLQAGP